jgi:hypothetical protein
MAFLYWEVEMETSNSFSLREAVCKNKLLLFRLRRMLS